MSFKKICLLVIFILMLNILPTFVNAQTQSQEISVHFAYYEGCPYCAKQKDFMESWKDKYPSVVIYDYDIYDTQQKKELDTLAEKYGFSVKGVPVTIIADQYWKGYTEDYGKKMEEKIEFCLINFCESPQDRLDNNQEKKVFVSLFYHSQCDACEDILNLVNGLEEDYNYLSLKIFDVFDEKDELVYNEYKKIYGLYETGYPIVFISDTYYLGKDVILRNLEDKIIYCYDNDCEVPEQIIKGITPQIPKKGEYTPTHKEKISLPFLGEIDINKTPVIWSTILISFVDGFNPCSIWLLVFLLGIVIYSGSRKKMITIGITFLIVTSLVYGLFIFGILNILNYLQHMFFIKFLVIAMALIFGLVNIKDFFWFQKGISFTVSNKQKPKIYDRIKKIMDPKKSFMGTILGTIVLAAGVTLVELPCTAGFPIIWGDIVASSGISVFGHFLLLLLYLLVYLSIEIVILIIAIVTMKIFNFDKKHGRLLKLISGTIMVGLAYMVIFNITGFYEMLLVFLFAIVFSLLVAKIYYIFKK